MLENIKNKSIEEVAEILQKFKKAGYSLEFITNIIKI